MLSILVCHSYFSKFDEKQRRRAKPYPPLATIHVAAMLRDAGHEVALFDAMLAEGVACFTSTLRAHAPDCVVIYEDNYNFLSKMCLGRMRSACREMIAQARAEGARVIVAGSDASDVPEVYLDAGADAVLLGEGLAALMALVDRLNRDPGIYERNLIDGLEGVVSHGTPMIGGPMPGVPLPVPALSKRPAWDLVDIEKYREIWTRSHGYFSLNMAASRGCSFRCNWCAKPIWGDRYLQRDAHEVADEMQYLKSRYGVEHIWFADDIFGFRWAWVEQFAEDIATGSGGMPFTIQLRADLVSRKMADALKRAGCREVWIGAESGSQKILDSMNKGTSVSEIISARHLLGERGIRVGFFLMLGYIGETFEDLLATRDLIESARPNDVGVSVAYPLPGTKFHEQVHGQLGEERNWQESKDLSMMFSGTYRSEFYRLVRNLLHEQTENGLTPSILERWHQLHRTEGSFRHARAMGVARRVAAFPTA